MEGFGRGFRPGSVRLLFHLHEPVAFVIPAARVRPAAFQAGDRAAEWPHPIVMAPAMGALILVTRPLAGPRQREIVAALLIFEAQVPARLTPFRAVGCDLPPPRAIPRDQVRQLMAQRFLDFFHAEPHQLRIHPHQ